METRRFALLAVLAVIVFFMYQAWQQDYGSGSGGAGGQQAGVTQTSNNAPSGTSASTVLRAPTAEPLATGGSETSKLQASAGQGNAGSVSVHTDTMDARIGLRGGGLRRLVLERYPVRKAHPANKLVFLDDVESGTHRPYLVLREGLAGTKKPLTDDTTLYASPQHQYTLGPQQKFIDVPLDYQSPDGYTVHVIYRFRRDSYQVKLIQKVTNKTGQPLQVGPYASWLRNKVEIGKPQKFVHSFFGIGVYEQKGNKDYRFKKISLGDLKGSPFEMKQTGGWLAMLQQYFIAVIIPKASEQVTFSAKPTGSGLFDAQMLGATAQLAPGSSGTFQTSLYIGPKLQGRLDAVAPGLGLTEDYGLLTPVAKPLFWVLSKFHQLTGNWGVAIILLTLLVRGAFFKLSESQYRSMAKMRKFGPRIKELRERFSGDKERLNKAMMELYKKEGFNPLAGCWPLVLQFPVFIALYWVLIESVELRQAPFVLWLQDLSSPDPYFVLPVLYGITMWAQQKLSGQTATMEPTQQKLMSVMPIGLAGFFSFFPSGLVLYYVVSNAFTIIQQWVITRRLENEGLSRR